MNTIASGTKIPLSNGKKAIVKRLLGEGGQGAVYLATVEGKDYALKIYNSKPNTAFMENLKRNIDSGAPTPHFLWPLWMVNTQSYVGYVMALRTAEYVEFSQFLIAKARFASWSAIVNAALQITYAFRELHRKGLSYQDLNDGNFFFNPKTGDVLVCDNDNVCPPDKNLGIKGKCRFMAPEVTIGKSNPNALSDYFSLAVVLFMLLMNNHPLDGKRVAEVPCLDDDIEREVYGIHPIFIYDPKNTSNRPVMGVHANVIKRWPLYPQSIRDAFTAAFSHEQLTNPNKRFSDNEWIKILLQLRSQTIVCSCGKETFVNWKDTSNCMNCNRSISEPLSLIQGSQHTMLYPGMKIYAYQTTDKEDLFSETGVVVRNKNNPALWGMSNLSHDTWWCTLPNGQTLDVAPGKGFPIYRNMKVTFTETKPGTIE